MEETSRDKIRDSTGDNFRDSDRAYGAISFPFLRPKSPSDSLVLCCRAMKHCDQYRAVYAGQSGRVLSAREIGDEIKAAYPDFNMGSNRPNDHAEGNACSCHCAKNRSNDPIFDKVGHGMYRVRSFTSG